MLAYILVLIRQIRSSAQNRNDCASLVFLFSSNYMNFFFMQNWNWKIENFAIEENL